ncbi:uncharacterized protein [Dendropsophus ebraccatus]|uniref:uncharacterized protein isoform X2 n=1 Tax=Dendropsophus ebraccatus TaxID=150705 RepID=UPI003831962D
MGKAKEEDPILVVDLSQEPQHTHTPLLLSQEHHHNHINPDRSQEHQQTHTHLDLSQEHHRTCTHLHRSQEHRRTHIHLHPNQGLHRNHIHLGHSQEPHRTHIHLHPNQGLHRNHIPLGHSQEPHRTHIHLDLNQEHQAHLQVLVGLTQELHLDNSLLRQMPRILEDPLDPIQEPLRDNQMPHSLHNLLGLMQECPQGHNQELPLGLIQMHLGNTLQLNILQVPLECQDPILTLLGLQVNNIQVLQGKVLHQVVLIQHLMVSQVQDKVGLGLLIHGDHRVAASIQQTQVCHTQPLAHSQLLVLHHLYHGVLCLLVSGGHLHPFLELVDRTLNQALIHEADYPSICLHTPETHQISLYRRICDVTRPSYNRDNRRQPKRNK